MIHHGEQRKTFLRVQSGLLLFFCPYVAWSMLKAASWIALTLVVLLWLMAVYFFVKSL